MSNRIDQELTRVMAAMSETAPNKPDLGVRTPEKKRIRRRVLVGLATAAFMAVSVVAVAQITTPQVLESLPTLGIGLPDWSVTGAYETEDGGGFRYIQYQHNDKSIQADLSTNGIPLGSDNEDQVLWATGASARGVEEVIIRGRTARMLSEPPDTTFVWREDDNTTVYLYVGIGTTDPSGLAMALAVAESVVPLDSSAWARHLADFPDTPVTTTSTSP